MTVITKVLLHFSEIDGKIIFFTVVHILLIVISKIHFYITVSTLFQKNNPFVYSLISDQF